MSILGRHYPETGVDQSLNNDLGGAVRIKDLRREVATAEYISQDVLRVKSLSMTYATTGAESRRLRQALAASRSSMSRTRSPKPVTATAPVNRE
jgi:hypothetical protein